MENNIFGFEYETETIPNRDSSQSRFSVVYGQNGRVVSCKKDSYKLVRTEDINMVASEFMKQGFQVKPYIERFGEKIGLNIGIGIRPSKVGDIEYRFHLNIPNNGNGSGYLKLFQNRLVCSNGMTRTISEKYMKGIRIPHNWSYKAALQLVTDVISTGSDIINDFTARDEQLASELIDANELTYKLNCWFFDREMPDDHKIDMSFDRFRQLLYEDPEQIKSIARYQQLMKARAKELEYNEELGLKISNYTVLATITNYLSRRIEKSTSLTPTEIMFERVESKLVMI